MQDGMVFETGKLPLKFLQTMLEKYAVQDASVVVGPGIGNDAAVIQMDETLLIAKSDPITFTTDDIGYYAIHVNANDIACQGGLPRWFLVTLLLPENRTTPELVETIFKQLSQECAKMNITLCGGHTEITYGIDRPIVVGHMLGTTVKERIVRPSGIRVGDDILVTKGIAIEGTSIIAREKYKTICDGFSKDLADRCIQLLYEPGISVVKEAQIIQKMAPVHAMHDPTEGGIAMGLHEMAQAADVGLMIERDKIPVLPEAKLLCDEYGLDVLGMIASGALLFAVSSHYSSMIIDTLAKENIPAEIIGKVTSKGADVRLKLNDEVIEMPVFYKDEIIKVFS